MFAIELVAASLALLSLAEGLYVSSGAGTAPVNHIVNARRGDPPGRVQSEVSVAAHDDVLVVVWNDSVGYYENVSGCGYAFSLDGGHTWRDGGELPNTAEVRVAGDPWITVARDGTFVVASVSDGNDDGIAIHRGRSVDDAFEWKDVTLHVRAGGEALDKPAIAYDVSTGALFLAYVNWSQNRGELVRSDDLGATWSEPIVVFESSRATSYVPAADRQGGVFVAWVDGIGQPGATFYVRHSADGGRAWSTAPTRFASLGPDAHRPPLGYDREVNATFPAIVVVPGGESATTRVVAAWTDGAPGTFDARYAWSDDHGRTWCSPRSLRERGTRGDAFWPALAIDDHGRVVAGWYDRRDATPERPSDTAFHITVSTDRGDHFGANLRMSSESAPWLDVAADFTPNFGDYVAVAITPARVVAAWSDARAGDPDVVVAVRPLRVPGNPVAAGGVDDSESPGSVLRVAPNPVPSGAIAHVRIPRGTRGGVHLYDVNGRLVRTVRPGSEAAGWLSFDVVDDDGRALPAGVYFARVAGAVTTQGARLLVGP